MNPMGLFKRLLAAEDPAVTAQKKLLERLEVLEEAFHELHDGCEEVLTKVKTWSAREAAKKRHEAKANLDELLGEDPQGSPVEGDLPQEIVKMSREEAARARRKAEISRQFRRGA